MSSKEKIRGNNGQSHNRTLNNNLVTLSSCDTKAFEELHNLCVRDIRKNKFRQIRTSKEASLRNTVVHNTCN